MEFQFEQVKHCWDVNDKASSYDVKSLLTEVNNISHKKVSNKYINHVLEGDKLDTKLYFKDHFFNIGVRLGYNRFDYKVSPGLYSIGMPTKDDDVIVTCNYKLTIDALRKELDSRNLWILVLDTDGVNVWCAAGKGSFGTAELVYSINNVDLKNVVNHKRLILPQLGAPGIQAHLVKETTGFNVIYGTVKACDLTTFIDNAYEATDEMRQVEFTVIDRLKVTPLELILGGKYLAALFVLSFIVSLLNDGININNVFEFLGIYAIGLFTGALVVPLIIPIRPFRMFYKNGILFSLLILIAYLYLLNWITIFSIGNSILAITISAYIAMNFTGATTFTSLSGVKKEMEQAIPILGVLLLIGLITSILGGILEVLSWNI